MISMNKKRKTNLCQIFNYYECIHQELRMQAICFARRSYPIRMFGFSNSFFFNFCCCIKTINTRNLLDFRNFLDMRPLCIWNITLHTDRSLLITVHCALFQINIFGFHFFFLIFLLFFIIIKLLWDFGTYLTCRVGPRRQFLKTRIGKFEQLSMRY